MSVRSFLDTNVLVYTDDGRFPAKRRRALALVAEHRRAGTGVVSLQVLQEYFAVATRKLGVDAAVARRKVEIFAELDVVVPDVADVLGAIDLHRLHELPFWDALVLRAAKQSGCARLLTEDLQGGKVIDGVRVVNPFEDLPAAARERPVSYRAPQGPHTIAESRITAQGQLSVPAEVRRRLGLKPGSVLAWEDEGGRIVVRRAGRYTGQEAHEQIFPHGPPKRRSLAALRAGVRAAVKKRHARR